MNFPSTVSKQQVDVNASGVSEHTRALAHRLSGHMGLDGAIQISTENQWHGVLSVLLEVKNKRDGKLA